MQQLERRGETEDCQCLRCRGLDGQFYRRSIAGDLLWAVGLLRRSPSLLVLVVALTAVLTALWPLLTAAPQTWPIGTAVAFHIFIHGTVLRAYTVAVTTEELTGGEESAWSLFTESQRWLPAIVIILAVTVLAGAVVLLFSSVVVWGLVQAAGEFSPLAGTAIASESILDGASASLIFGSVTAIAMFKLWLAPEICVAGGYGPLTGIRLSYSLSSLYWWRVVLIVTGFATTAFLPELGGRTLTVIGADWLRGTAVTGIAQSLFFGVSYVVWFAVGTQIYVRHAVTAGHQE